MQNFSKKAVSRTFHHPSAMIVFLSEKNFKQWRKNSCNFWKIKVIPEIKQIIVLAWSFCLFLWYFKIRISKCTNKQLVGNNMKRFWVTQFAFWCRKLGGADQMNMRIQLKLLQKVFQRNYSFGFSFGRFTFLVQSTLGDSLLRKGFMKHN